MNPALYKLPLRIAKSCSRRDVCDREGACVASFETDEQAADFVAELNKHAPKQPTRPRELWALWHEKEARFSGARDAFPFIRCGTEADMKAYAEEFLSDDFRMIRFDTLPLEGETT